MSVVIFVFATVLFATMPLIASVGRPVGILDKSAFFTNLPHISTTNILVVLNLREFVKRQVCPKWG
jgi:hypothetical protein